MKRSHRRLLISGIGVLLVSGVAVTSVWFSQTPKNTPAAAVADVKTETVSRGELVESVSLKGTLAYAAPRELGTSLNGTVTSVAGVGTTVSRGGELFRIDDRPVMLLHGNLPAWRPFESGMTAGRDVQQLEQNLAELGYFDYEPDEHFDWNTATAIGAWEKELGLRWTGRLDLGQVVFAAGDVRVASVKVPLGSPAGPSILGVSDTTKLVTAQAATSLRDVLDVGAAVELTLPDGVKTTGTVTSVGAPVEQENRNGEKSVKLPVTVSLDDEPVAGQYADVGVTVSMSRVLSEDSLLVPVAALLADTGGGFAVEVASKPAHDGAVSVKRVAVELGQFADGMVEVTGGELAAGDRVVVAS